ncbi:MAG: hypothetical protein ABH896_02630 [Candidatus Jacksonbacteria bacterium]
MVNQSKQGRKIKKIIKLAQRRNKLLAEFKQLDDYKIKLNKVKQYQYGKTDWS